MVTMEYSPGKTVPIPEATIAHTIGAQNARGEWSVVLGLVLENGIPFPVAVDVQTAKEIRKAIDVILGESRKIDERN